MNITLTLKPGQAVLSGEGYSYTFPIPTDVAHTNNVILEDGHDFDSSSMSAITYEPATEILGVKFHGGQTLYRYQGVPLYKVFNFVNAHSLNEYWRSDIQPHYSALEKVDYLEYTENL